jgi:hypothetical protein
MALSFSQFQLFFRNTAEFQGAANHCCDAGLQQLGIQLATWLFTGINKNCTSSAITSA